MQHLLTTDPRRLNATSWPPPQLQPHPQPHQTTTLTSTLHPLPQGQLHQHWNRLLHNIFSLIHSKRCFCFWNISIDMQFVKNLIQLESITITTCICNLFATAVSFSFFVWNDPYAMQDLFKVCQKEINVSKHAKYGYFGSYLGKRNQESGLLYPFSLYRMGQVYN